MWVDWYSITSEQRNQVHGEVDIRDPNWVPITLKRDVEYSEMLEGVVDSLKHVANVISLAQSLPT